MARLTLLTWACLLASLGVAPSSASAAGTTFFVSPSGSGSSCAANSQAQPFATIQAALACADDGDAVQLAPSGSTPYPGIGTVTDNVVIEAAPGADARSVKIDVSEPDDTSGTLTVPATTSVTVQGVTIDCVARTCKQSNVTNHGTLALRDATITGAQWAVAVLNSSNTPTPAHLSVIGTTIAHNQNLYTIAGAQGGGIASIRATLADPLPTATIANSTIADNDAPTSQGGGIYVPGNAPGLLTLTNTTITANNAPNGAGGIFTGNSSTPVTATNTLIAGNTSAGTMNGGPDCGGRITDGAAGHNLLGDATGCTGLVNGVNGNQVGVPSPGLNTLADNGGPTDTNSLQATSPAIGAADAITCLVGPIGDVDQRGYARNSAATCDIGAYEASGTAPPPPDTTDPTVTITTPPDGATYTPGQVVMAEYSCDDEPGGSGMAGCLGTVGHGQPIDTSVGDHSFTVTATDTASNGTTQTVHYTVKPASDPPAADGPPAADHPPTAGPAPPADRAVTLGALGLSPTVFKAARSGASTSAKKQSKAKVGTRVTFNLSERGWVRFTVERKLQGRESGKRCVARRKSNRKKTACARWVKSRGAFTITGETGKNTFTFRGRVGGKSLKPGRYRVNGQATDTTKHRSAIRRTGFVIVR
jgi:hypothetical protein